MRFASNCYEKAEKLTDRSDRAKGECLLWGVKRTLQIRRLLAPLSPPNSASRLRNSETPDRDRLARLCASVPVAARLAVVRLPAFAGEFRQNDRLGALQNFLGQARRRSDLGLVAAVPAMQHALGGRQIRFDVELDGECAEQQVKRARPDPLRSCRT
jgi:hypothetical protein